MFNFIKIVAHYLAEYNIRSELIKLISINYKRALMKKIITLFSFILMLGFLFVGCQSTEDITSPNDLSKTTSMTPDLNWGTPTAVNTTAGASTDVPLIAGQNQPCGHITISSDGTKLYVTYYTDNGWTLTETHLMIVKNPADFIVTKTGNPKVGNFPFGNTGLSTNKSVTYEIPYPAGVKAGDVVYVGAHAVVLGNCESDPTTAVLCPEFPANSTMTPTWLPGDAPLYTVKAVFNFSSEVYYGFCVDNSRYISGSGNSPRTVNFICSYDEMPTCTSFIEKPENLDLVNWIINNREPNWDRRTLQAVFWELTNPSGTLDNWYDPQGSNYWTHNTTLREQIVALAKANGEGFKPSCGQKVIVLVYGPGDICDPIKQIVFIEVPVECQTNCNSETAWAFNYPPLDNTSASFPGANWFRYFGYKVN